MCRVRCEGNRRECPHAQSQGKEGAVRETPRALVAREWREGRIGAIAEGAKFRRSDKKGLSPRGVRGGRVRRGVRAVA